MPQHTYTASVLAANLRRELDARSMTQRDLAREINVADARISEIFAGGNPRLSTMEKIADALDMSVAALLSAPVPREKLLAKSG